MSKAQALMSEAMRHHTELVSSANRPAPSGAAVPMYWMAPMMPMSMPEATMAGMIGTNTSESTLMARWKALPFWATSSFCSSLVAAVTPGIFTSSS